MVSVLVVFLLMCMMFSVNRKCVSVVVWLVLIVLTRFLVYLVVILFCLMVFGIVLLCLLVCCFMLMKLFIVSV